MTLPYENATSGKNAMSDIQKTLQRFGCQSFGCMDDFENKKIIVQFKYRDMPISVEASIAGYAAAWLKEHPYNSNYKYKKTEHEQRAIKVANVAVYSILRDWIKGQVTAIECGILSFEGAFLGQILLSTGKTVLQHVSDTKVLKLVGPQQLHD